MNYRNESEIMYAIRKFLDEHQVPFNIAEISQHTNYIYDFYLPKGLENAKFPLGKGYVKYEIEGPVAIEVKGRLLFDTIQRYVTLFTEELAPQKEVSSFLLVYVEGKLPSILKYHLEKLKVKGFYVLSLSQFLGMQIDTVIPKKKFNLEEYDWVKDRDKILEIAKVSLQDKDFSLFFGAGVSMSAKLPSWWKPTKKNN